MCHLVTCFAPPVAFLVLLLGPGTPPATAALSAIISRSAPPPPIALQVSQERVTSALSCRHLRCFFVCQPHSPRQPWLVGAFTTPLKQHRGKKKQDKRVKCPSHTARAEWQSSWDAWCGGMELYQVLVQLLLVQHGGTISHAQQHCITSMCLWRHPIYPGRLSTPFGMFVRVGGSAGVAHKDQTQDFSFAPMSRCLLSSSSSLDNQL